MRAAIARIALADLVMSLDNVIAIAGMSRSDPVSLVVGLILSITMILTLSTLIVAIMNRFRWVVYAGAAILALTAAGMMEHDLLAFSPAISEFSHQDSNFELTGWSLRLAVALALPELELLVAEGIIEGSPALTRRKGTINEQRDHGIIELRRPARRRLAAASF